MTILLVATPAAARSPVNTWFCQVLKVPFDPAAAIAAFPLEQLPPAEETRKEKRDDDNVTRVSVRMEAAGEKYRVEYSYQYKTDDVSSPYGFDLSVELEDYSMAESFGKDAKKWLSEFGKPKKSILGGRVSAGPPLYEGGDQVFYFESWDRSSNYSANWFHRGDLRYAAELCK